MQRQNDDKPVTLYTSPTCHWCRVAKRYLEEQDITYSEIDIISDHAGRREMVLMTGQHGVPVVRVGEHAMIGWDEAEFELLRAGRFKRR